MAQAFAALHHGDSVLLLANVWDAGSAAIIAAAGAGAIATSSAGVAWSCGYPDGDALPRAKLLDVVAAICRVAGKLPVSADIEAGFSSEPRDVAELACALCDLGVAGVNIEDGAQPADLLAAKIEAIKRAVAQRGGNIFINARTDVYLRGLAHGEEAVRESIARGQRYLQAGADGFFVPELRDPAAIQRIARAVALPLNLLVLAGLAPAAELYELGVRRLSGGSALAKRAYGVAADAANAFFASGEVSALCDQPALDYRQTNALLQAAAGP